jgi:uracil phosphoribosyltransferase
MSSWSELQHPLAAHHLAILRDAATPPAQFRNQVDLLATLLAIECTQDLKLAPISVKTPIGVAAAKRLSQRIAIVPILRAGLGLVNPVLQLLPEAEVWHLGMYRDEETALPVEYYSKLPADCPADVGLVLDPMLATGGSIRLAIGALKKWGVADIRVLSVIASEPGLKQLANEFPDVRIWVGAIDPELNDRKFIVPGLGDAGDRIFNTRA